MSVVFASPGLVTPGPISGSERFKGLAMSWTGWNGHEFPLTARRSGLILKKDGVEGLDTPPWEVYSQTSPGVHGSRARGWRAQPRPCFWPIMLYSDTSSTDWLTWDRAFWKTLQPLKYGTWTVEHPMTQERRYLRCRFDGEPAAFPLNPFRKGWANYGIALVADEEPFWLGDPVIRRFAAEAPEEFFNDGKAPVFRISSGSAMSRARVTNTGDLEAWPIWKISGPTTSVRVGLNGLQVEVPFEIFEGQTVEIDTRPHKQIALRHTATGTEDVTHLLGAAEFVAIPDGENISLDLEVIGTGEIVCSFEPRYLRAW